VPSAWRRRAAAPAGHEAQTFTSGPFAPTGGRWGGEQERESEATEDPTRTVVPAWFRLAQPELRLRLPGVNTANRTNVREKAGTWGAVARPAVFSKAAVPCFEYQLVGAHVQCGSSLAALPAGGDASSCDVKNHSWISSCSHRDRARFLTCCCWWGGAEACYELRPKVLVPRTCQIQGVGGARTHDKSPCRAPGPRRYGLRASQRRLAAAPGYCPLPMCSCCARIQEHGCLERDLGLMIACQVMRLTLFSWWKTQMPGTSTERAVAACV